VNEDDEDLRDLAEVSEEGKLKWAYLAPVGM